MKLTMFVANAGGQANKPKERRNVLRLNLPPKSERLDDLNLAVFAGDENKSGIVELQGLADGALSEFSAGQSVTVTITVDP